MMEARTRELFEDWSATDRSEKMAMGHRHLLEAIILKLESQGFPSSGHPPRILDVGCGVGDALEILGRRFDLPSSALAGLDLSQGMLKRARQKLPEADFRQGTALQLEWGDGSFDAMISIESLYYHEKPSKSLEEACRILKPGSPYLCAMDFYGENTGTRTWPDVLGLELRCQSEKEWAKTFQDAGFAQVQTFRVRLPDPEAALKNYQSSPYFPTPESYQTYLEEGSLLVMGESSAV